MMVDIGGDDTGLRDNLSLLRPIRVNRSRFPNGAELLLTLTPTLTLTLTRPLWSVKPRATPAALCS